MGWAIPAAIGAQRVRPDRQVVCVTGDGCFLMSAMEMSSAARAGLPVKFFVFDDGAYHYMQMLQEPVYRRTTATEIARIDYAAFARGVGLGYNQIACNADVVPGIQRTLGLPGPDPDPRDGQLRRPRDPLARARCGRTTSTASPTGQKVRMAARIGVRTVSRRRRQRLTGFAGRTARRRADRRSGLRADDVDLVGRRVDLPRTRRARKMPPPMRDRAEEPAGGRRARDDSKHGCSHELLGPTPTTSRRPRRPRAERLAERLAEDRDELARFWPVIQNMVVQELRVRYQRSMLGFLWTLLNPILMMATLSLVFSQLFDGMRPNYALYLFAGMVPWGFLAEASTSAPSASSANEGLIRKIYLPKLVFPLSRVLINLVTFVLSIGRPVPAARAARGAQLSPPMLLLPVAIVLLRASSRWGWA